jgi:hypothetical protein
MGCGKIRVASARQLAAQTCHIAFGGIDFHDHAHRTNKQSRKHEGDQGPIGKVRIGALASNLSMACVTLIAALPVSFDRWNSAAMP